jgi:hypothetical protein
VSRRRICAEEYRVIQRAPSNARMTFDGAELAGSSQRFALEPSGAKLYRAGTRKSQT